MGGGGSMDAMNSSLKKNKALRRGRNHLFERPVDYSWGEGKQQPITEAENSVSPRTRERYRGQLLAERRADRRKLAWSIILGVLVIAAWYYYGEEFMRLIVHQPGRP